MRHGISSAEEISLAGEFEVGRTPEDGGGKISSKTQRRARILRGL